MKSRPWRSRPRSRLDSWKEIAAYLNRDVTTVQRWEKREGMPVHRHVHDKRGSVYALTEELDEWIQSRRPRVDEPEKNAEAEIPPAAPSGRRGTGRARGLACGLPWPPFFASACRLLRWLAIPPSRNCYG